MIIYEDNDIIVCHKPSGVSVQTSRIGEKDMVSILNNHLFESARPGSKPSTVHVIHRLDQPVEGGLVFAKNKKAAANLTRQITDGSVEKIYHALCCKTDSADTDYIASLTADTPCHLENYLVKNNRTNSSSVCPKNTPGAKYAELYFHVLEQNERFVLVEIHLLTGRHHQIRVQMSHAGLPLAGDRKYNSRWNEFVFPQRQSLALCAVSLTFHHPRTGKKMEFKLETPFRIEAGADKSLY